MRIWPPDAAKCCKNAGKFFPDIINFKTTNLISLRGTKRVAATLKD